MIYGDDNIHDALEKVAGVLPSFLSKARRDGFIDPRSDDFAKNQAFGRGVGASLMFAPATAAGLALRSPRLAAAFGLSGLGAGGVTYTRKLKKFRDAQKKGLNPATMKKYDSARIQKAADRAAQRRKKKQRT